MKSSRERYILILQYHWYTDHLMLEHISFDIFSDDDLYAMCIEDLEYLVSFLRLLVLAP